MLTAAKDNVTASSNLTSLEQPSGDVRNEQLARIEITVQAVVFAVTMLGNACVLLALKLRRNKLTRMLFFVMHLSFADMQVALLQTLPQLAWDITFRFKGGNLLCKLVKFLQIYAMYLSTYVLVMTAIDRHQAICKPLSSYSWTMKRAHLMVGIAYGIAVVLSIPQPILFSETTWPIDGNATVTDCWSSFTGDGARAYATWYVFSIYIIPLAIISFCYGHICVAIWKNLERKTSTIRLPLPRETSNGFSSDTVDGESQDSRHNHLLDQTSDANNPRAHSTKVITKAKIKTVKLTLVVVICYVVCWCPYFATLMYAMYHPRPNVSSGYYVVFMLLASLNSAVNPWIYMAFTGISRTLGDFFLCKRSNLFRNASRSSGSTTKTSVVSAFKSNHGQDPGLLRHSQHYGANARNGACFPAARRSMVEMLPVRDASRTSVSSTGRKNSAGTDTVAV